MKYGERGVNGFYFEVGDTVLIARSNPFKPWAGLKGEVVRITASSVHIQTETGVLALVPPQYVQDPEVQA